MRSTALYGADNILEYSFFCKVGKIYIFWRVLWKNIDFVVYSNLTVNSFGKIYLDLTDGQGH